MTYTWLQDVPITVDIYREIVAGLGDAPPEGLILHIARVMDDSHLQYLDVWESEAACERFTEERLHPVVGPALARHQVRPEGGEPPRRPVQVAHVWAPAAANAWPNAQPQPASSERL
ncbi:MAG: hypothetical protein M3069_18345 [Chloroflexota bacterium]|nr:hypothetical protein [Chloroflexota bacterium]